MRFPASEKLEIIRLVEQSHLPAKRTLSKPGIPKATLYRWCAGHEEFGEAGLADRLPHPGRVGNRIPASGGEEVGDGSGGMSLRGAFCLS